MTDLNNILITGSEGMIGSHLDFGIKKSRRELDVTKKEEIKKICDKTNPSGILCLSSIDLRKCEENPLEAYKVNVFGIYNLAKEAKKRKIPLILLSTGAVFSGGAEDSFSEESIPNPLNIYSQTKYLAEIITLENSNKNLVVRTGWVFGTNKDSKKKNIFDKMLDSAIEGKEIKATYDQYGSPVYIKDLISELKKLISKNCSGIYHIANFGRASAVDFIEEVVTHLKNKSKINKLSVAEFISNIKRSPSECLVSKKIKLRSWQEALKDYLHSKGAIKI